jgi:hypothetical protein
MTEKKKIKAKEIIGDLRSGAPDEEIMKKYGINDEQFKKLLAKLVDAQLINEMELYERTTLSDTAITAAYVDTLNAIGELDQEALPPPPRSTVEPEGHVEVTEVHDIDRAAIEKMMDRMDI